MTRIATTTDAFEAITATLPVGSIGLETEADAKGERLTDMRGSGEADRRVCLMGAQ